MEIKIIYAENQLLGVQKTASGVFNDYYERHLYLGAHGEGEIVEAKLVDQALYPGNQWTEMPERIAATTDRQTRRVYLDD